MRVFSHLSWLIVDNCWVICVSTAECKVNLYCLGRACFNFPSMVQSTISVTATYNLLVASVYFLCDENNAVW